MKYILLYLTVFISFFSGKTPKPPTHDLKSIEIYAITYEKQYPTKMSLKEVKRHPETHVKETHVSVQSYSGIETALAKLKKDPDYQEEDDFRAVAILRYKRITRTMYIAGNGRIYYNGVLYLPQPDLLKQLYFFIPERYGINKHTEDFFRQRYVDQPATDIKPAAPAKAPADSTTKKK